ncbi:MAG: ABC transporter substrate-binding protein [Desulfobacteraceae bacterium]|nr:ABC transporter substrate-binding protein [Desulfobacteraceae bacterium]
MSRLINYILVGLMLILTLFLVDVCAQDAFKTTPLTNHGKKWRIGYLEGGAYSNYQSILKAMIESLMNSGWIERASIPKCKNESETLTLWNFLSTKIKSNYLTFPADAYYSSNWDNTLRQKIGTDLIRRLKIRNDIDLMLAFGTWAGQDLANNKHSTPTMILSCSDAVYSGIIKSVEDSGFDHIHAWIDSKKTKRQIRLFYEIVGFKRLGLLYENDLDGRSYSAVEAVLKLSKELNFEVIEYHLPLDVGGIAQEEIELVKGYELIAPRIDAMFITDYGGLTKKNIKKLLTPLFEYKVPSFAQTRYDLVKHGILMSAGRANFNADAKFYVQTFSKILNGAKPGSLPQEFASPLKIAVNLESAKKAGFRLPIDILSGAYEIHETIADIAQNIKEIE